MYNTVIVNTQKGILCLLMLIVLFALTMDVQGQLQTAVPAIGRYAVIVMPQGTESIHMLLVLLLSERVNVLIKMVD